MKIYEIRFFKFDLLLPIVRNYYTKRREREVTRRHNDTIINSSIIAGRKLQASEKKRDRGNDERGRKS